MRVLRRTRKWRYLRRRGVVGGLLIVGGMIALGVMVPAIGPYSATGGTNEPFAAPSAAHWFGTDNFGRDVFTRTFASARLDIGLSIAGVAGPLVAGTFIGGVLGLTTSRFTGLIGSVAIEAVNAFPFLVVAAAVIAITGPGIGGVLLALFATNWARYARLARTRATVVAQSDYVAATRTLGYSSLRILVRHVLPNILDVSFAYGISDLVIVILATAGLSFLGLGVQPPAAEWGGMLADGRSFMQQAWWMVLFPGLALSATAIGLNFLAEGVRAVQHDE
jgi:peptide/nickel transport system permease protein